MRLNERHRRHSGFTLIEILIAIGLMSLIIAVAYPIFHSMLVFGQQQKTHTRLAQAAAALKSAYESHAMMVDSQSSGQFFCAAGSLNTCIKNESTTRALPSAASATTALGTTTSEALTAIAEAQGINVRNLEVDGFNRYFHYFVSNELKSQSCVTCKPIHYRVVAVVSSGGRNSLSPKTQFDPNTGQLLLGNGDQGVVVSGLPIEQAYYNQTKSQLRRIASAYGQFFISRFLSSSSRNPSIDYFSKYDSGDALNSQSYDNTSPVCNSGNMNCGWNYNGFPYPGQLGTPITNTALDFVDCQPATSLGGFMAAIGLATSDVTTPWGFPVGVCNGPNAPGMGGQAIRDPSANNTSLESPPYTADIVAWAPDGVPLIESVVGKY